MSEQVKLDLSVFDMRKDRKKKRMKGFCWRWDIFWFSERFFQGRTGL